MANTKINTVIDLETAKDKLRASLTKLENTVENKIKKAAAEAANSGLVDAKRELITVKSNLTEVNTENLSLKKQIHNSEEEIVNLKSLQNNMVQQIDKIIEKVENEIKYRDFREVECQS